MITENRIVVVAKPKFVRVNTLKTTVDEIINLFRDEGWTLVRHLEDKNYENFLTKLSSLSPEEFMLDLHVKDLLIFPPKTEFHQYPFYKDGRIMIQDKASCLPAILLNPEPGSTVLDTCAAPGMKTTQMAALMKNEGTIFAVEFNTKRFVSLNKMVESSGATCVKTINRDVITLTSQDCPNVDYVLIDPSCSGSGTNLFFFILQFITHYILGIVDRNDFGNKREIKTNLDRLEKLAGFQIKILKTALNRFPKAKRIVYSTCSLYTQENEEVVKEVLASNTKFKLVPADKFLTAPWNSFGSAKYGDIGKFCLYSRPEKDHTNGFFVAVFERLEEGEENPFIVIDLERKPKGKKDVEIVSVTTIKKKNKNKKKKDSVVDLTSSLSQTAGLEEDSQDNIQKLKKKKRHNSSDTLENNEHEIVISEHQNGFAKDKKKRKQSESLDNCDVAKKRENMENGDAVQNGVDVENNSLEAKKKKRKRDKGEEALPDTVIIDCDNDSGNCDKKSKKKKRTKQDISTIEINHTNQEGNLQK